MDHRPQSPPIEIEGAATGRKTTSRKRKAAAEEESQAAEEDQSTAGNLPMALSETSSADWITTLSNSAITRERCIETILGPVKSTLDGSPNPTVGSPSEIESHKSTESALVNGLPSDESSDFGDDGAENVQSVQTDRVIDNLLRKWTTIFDKPRSRNQEAVEHGSSGVRVGNV